MNNICNEKTVNNSNSCQNDQKTNKTNNGQAIVCNDGYFNNGQCNDCGEQCEKCANNVCYLCKPNYQLVNGKCESINGCNSIE